MTSTTSYTASGIGPELGLATQTVQDSGSGLLNLTSTSTYEAPGAGYLRRTGRTLPAGTGSSVAYLPYGGTDAPTTNTCGVSSTVKQAGLPKQTTQADPDGTGGAAPLVRQFVYDTLGRPVGSRADTNVSTAGWTCSRGSIPVAGS